MSISAHICRLAAFGSGLTVAVFMMMLVLGWPLLSSGQFFSLLFQQWLPGQGIYGIYPMLLGSIAIALLAMCLSLPISLGTAFVAATLASRPWRKCIVTAVRFMAGIPTVIYGFVAVFLLVPFMREQLTGGSGMNLLTAGAVLALLIAPTMIVFFVSGLSRWRRAIASRSMPWAAARSRNCSTSNCLRPGRRWSQGSSWGWGEPWATP